MTASHRTHGVRHSVSVTQLQALLMPQSSHSLQGEEPQSSDTQSEHGDHTVQRAVLPAQHAASCGRQRTRQSTRPSTRQVTRQSTGPSTRQVTCQSPQNVPSVVLSQKQALAVCIPAPFFCMMVQLTGHVRHTALTTVSQQQPPSRCHSDTAHTDVFERLPQLAELTEALFHHFVAPLVHSAVLVLRPSDGALHGLQPQNTTQLHTHGTHGIKQLHITQPSRRRLSPSGGC